MDWLIESLSRTVAKAITSCLDAFTNLFLGAFAPNMDAMEAYFPSVNVFFDIIMIIGLTLVVLLLLWNLVKNFFMPIAEAESPLRCISRSLIAGFCVINARGIMDLILTLFVGPYNMLQTAEFSEEVFTYTAFADKLNGAFSSTLSTTFMLLPTIFLIIAVAWNYIKLLLEAGERYVALGVLYFTSPLGLSTAGSKNTIGIFSAWAKMVISQGLLLIFNLWFLRGFNAMMGQVIANGTVFEGELGAEGGLFIWVVLAVAFLKIGQRIDSYLSTLGLSAAHTGGALAAEIMGGVMMVSQGFRMMRMAGSRAGSGNAGRTGSTSSPGFTTKLSNTLFGNRDARVHDANVKSGTAARPFSMMYGTAANKYAGKPLSPNGVSQLVNRGNSDYIDGATADKSLYGYFPHMEGKQLSNSVMSGQGIIQTEVAGADGTPMPVSLYNSSMFEAPEGAYSTVTAADGSTWYQVSDTPGATEAVHGAYHFLGQNESGEMASMFGADATRFEAESGSLRTVGDGMMEYVSTAGSETWFSAAAYEEPTQPHGTHTDSNGLSWYSVSNGASIPDLSGTDAVHTLSAYIPDAARDVHIAAVDASRAHDGIIDAISETGEARRYYDSVRWAPPTGDYDIRTSATGEVFYSVRGQGKIEHVVVYDAHGEPRRDPSNGKILTKEREIVRYSGTARRFAPPIQKDRGSKHKIPRRRK